MKLRLLGGNPRAWVAALLLGFLTSITPVITSPEALTSANAVASNPTPVCDGDTCVITFSYVGDYYSWQVPKTATYTIEVWGAQGGDAGYYSYQAVTGLGGKGGYAKGEKSLTENETLHVYVGGQGTSTTGSNVVCNSNWTNVAGGWNGGGTGNQCGMTGGGGASDVRYGGTALSNRIIVAGGGGGAGNSDSTRRSDGGAGGGTNGVQMPTSTQFGGRTAGAGGTQSTGYQLGIGEDTLGNNLRGAGGGGYWGGKVGDNSTGGGGGSGYVGNLANSSLIAGDQSMPNPSGGTMTGRSGNGLVKISYPDCVLGTKQECPGDSAMEIKTVTGTNTDGLYWINVNGVATRVYAIMSDSLDGGGWVLAMKSKLNSSTFTYSSDYWTTNNTLIPTGEVSPAPLGAGGTGNNEDAKYATFNNVAGDQILVVYRGIQISNSNVYGGAIKNQTYGFTWKEDLPSGYKNNTLLNLFSTIPETSIRDAKSAYESGDYPYKTSDNKVVFSTQDDVRFFGFNYVAENMGDAWEKRARWGFGWNENDAASGEMYPNAIQDSNDAAGGIGLHVLPNTSSYSAGDFNSCCTTDSGLNRSFPYELYIRKYPVAPAPPTAVSATKTGSTSATVSFTAPTRNGGSAVTGYTAYSSPGNITASISQSGSGTISITGLSSSTSYTFTVKATNAQGTSRASGVSNSITTDAGATAPGAPTITSITPGDTQLSVAFSAPGSNGGATITNYAFSTDNGVNWTTRNPVSTASPIVITGLTNRTSYNIKIQAINSVGPGTESASTAATPRASLTFTTPNSGLTGTTGTSFSLNATTSGGLAARTFSIASGALPVGLTLNTSTGQISGTPIESGSFPITLRVSDGSATADTSSFTLSMSSSSGLTMYIKNQAGASQSLGTPTAFNTGLCGSGISTIFDYDWSSGKPTIDSTSQSGCNADGFTVYAKGTIKGPVTGPVTFCAFTDDGFYLKINGAVVIDSWIDQGVNSNCNATGVVQMVQNTVYPIEVWHHENAGGAVFKLHWSYSGQSRIAVPSTQFTTGSVALSILTPSSGLSATKGVPFSLNVVAVGGTGTKTFSLSSGTLPGGLTLNSTTGLISGTPTGTDSATIRVTVSAGGSSAQTDAFTIAAAGVPGAPTQVTGTTTGVTGDGRLKVTWQAPSSTGGSSITNYEIRYALDGVLAWSNWFSVNGLTGNTNADREVTLTGLQNAKSYVVQVRAVNSVGTGPNSDSSSVVAASGAGAQRLGAPLNPTVVAGDGRLTLNFTANPISGGAVTSSVLFNTLGETCNREDYWIVRSNVLTAHQFTAGGAATITKVEFRMGAGLQQYPSQIRIVFYSNGVNNTIGTRIIGELTFASSASNVAVYTGSVSIPSSGTYWIQQQPISAIANHYYCGTSSTNATGSAVGWAQNRNRFAYIDAANAAATQYFAGTSYFYPMFRITAESSEAALNAITEYQYSLDGGTSWKSVAVGALSAGPSIVITGLANGTTYDVRLRAVNSAGPGDIANLSTARPGVGPSVPRDKALSLGNLPGQIVTTFKTPTTTGGLTLTYQYRLKDSATLPANPTYYPSGPQANVAVSTVTSGGWTRCYSDEYRTIADLSTILNACNGKYILLAAGPKNNANYLLVAAGERDSVFKATDANQTTLNNGTYWYYRTSASMGFAPTATIQQSSADVFDRASPLRMSWHLGHCGSMKICGGWRVGTVVGLNGSTDYIREIYVSAGNVSSGDEGWGEWTTKSVTTAVVSNEEVNTMVISPITNNKTYSVQVRAVNSLGNSVATVAQNIDARRATGPSITTQPTSRTLTLNQAGALTLSVVAQAAGQETLTYQWFKGGVAIAGATSATYTVAGPINSEKKTAHEGNYYVEVTGTLNNTSGVTRSETVTVSVRPEPVVKTNPAVKNGTVGAAYSHQLELNDGTGTPTLTWALAPGSSLPTGLSLTSDGRIVGTPTISSAAAASSSATSGSFAFNGSSSYLSVPASSDWATGTGDFTVEWWQYQTDNNPSPRIFTVGTGDNANIPLAAGIENGLFYGWLGGTGYNFGSVGSYKNAWVHFAFVRSGNTLRVFKNGVLLGSTSTDKSAASSNDPLFIGYKNNTASAFGGFITNFHFVKGTALYSANFVASTNTSAVANTKLLLLSSTSQSYLLDSGGANKSVTSTGVTFNTSSPSQGAATKDVLQNGNFASSLVNDPTKGWAEVVRPGGPALIGGGGLVFSYGPPACTNQANVQMGEVQQKVTISQPGTVTFKVKVDARVWNRIGSGYSNPCHDPYQVTLRTSGGATATSGRIFSTESNATNATNSSTTLGSNLLWQEITVPITTTSANEVVTISLFGLDSGYWAGNYGPKFYDASLTLSGGGGSGGGTSSSTVIVTDANGRTAQHTFTINVSPAISITTKTLPNGATGASYSQTLTAEGGTGPGTYSWALAAGSTLPNGLTLTSNGVIGTSLANDATSRTFSVTVTDGNGAVVTQSLSITVSSGLPGAPTSLTAGTVADKTVPLTWTAPTDTGGSAITQYIIAYSAPKGTDPNDTEDVDSGTVTVSASGLTFPYNLTNLRNGRTYTISVKARNSSAIGNSSNSVSAKPVVISAAPSDLSLALANGGLTIRWKKPTNTGGNPITSYKVQCSTNGNTWVNITDRIDDGVGEFISVVAITNLSVGSSYNCRVAAVTASGDGAFATTTSPATLATPPSTPQGAISGGSVGANITGVIQTPGRMVVTWSKSADSNGSAITSYIATVARNYGENSEIRRSCSVSRNDNDDTSGYSCTVLGIPKKGNFRVWVIAVNAVGNSAEKLTTVNQAGVSQTLTIPAGYPATFPLGKADFSIGATVNSGLPVQYSTTTTAFCTITDRGLVKLVSPGTCTVKINQDGKDASGNETEYAAISESSVTITVTDKIPGTPRFNAVVPASEQMTITWFAPSNSGGTTTAYDFQTAVYDKDNPNAALTWSSSTTFAVSGANQVLSQVISGLLNNTQYKVRMRATNNSGNSASDWVEYQGAVTVYGVPAKPQITSVTSDAANGSVVVAWSAPSDNGSAITGYEVSATSNGQTTRYCYVGGASTSCTIYGLVNKVEYSYVLLARNLAGASANSDAYLTTVPGIAQEITLLSTPASDGWTVDSPNYQIQATTNSGAALTFASGNNSICTVSASGSVTFVSAGSCQITISQNGNSTRYLAATNVIVNFTVSPSVPSAPRITTFTSAGSGLTINWAAPSRTGGTITGYTLTATRAGSTTRTCSVANVTSCELNNLDKGLIYEFTLIATNAAGNSPASTLRTAGWYAVATAPVLASATASATDGRAIEVTWNKSTSDGGAEITRYIATATSGGTSKTCAVVESGSATSSCVIRDLRAGTQYAVTVKAENAVGLSVASNSINATPGIAQVVTIGSPASPTPKNFGDPDFRITASIDSGNLPTFTSGNTSVCTVDSSGKVRIVGVGQCIITVAHPGSTDANESQFKASNNATITINVAAIAPSAPTILRATPDDQKVTVVLAAPASLGGGTLTTYEYSTDGGATWVTPNSPITSTTFDINGLTNDNLYSIRVRANNGTAGAASNALSATPYSRPTAPTPLVVTGGNSSASLSWTQPATFSGTLVRYEVFRRIAGSGSLTQVHATANASTTSFADSNLAAGTSYEYQVRAVALVNNAEVNGDFTNSSFATTFSAPSAPRNVGAERTFTTSPSLSVVWRAPLSNGGSPITGYVATASAGGQNVQCSSNASTLNCVIEGLTSGTSYSISVVATSAAGTSSPSDSITVSPLGKPSSPSAVSVQEDLENGSATISWTAPAGTTPTSYTARAYVGNTSTSTPLTCTKAHVDGTSSYSCTITGLNYKTAYVFAVIASNSMGSSELSSPSSSINLQKTQTITFNALNDVTWLTRSILLNARASSALGVTFVATPAGVCTVSGSALTITGLGTCTVTASQSGEGTAFGAATSVTRTFAVTATQPSAVTLLSIVPGAGSLAVSWSAATELGGSASATYLISYATNPNFSDELSITTASTTATLSGLTPGATYSVRVRVLTPDFASGSAWSNLLQGKVLGVPSAPKGTSVTAGAGTLTVAWEAVDQEANGGSPILGYKVKALLGVGDANPATCITSGTTCVIGGLDGSQFYTVQVFAVNAVGDSEAYEFADDYRPSATQTISAAGATKSRAIGKHRIGASTDSGLPLTYTIVSSTPTDPIANRSVCTVDANGELTFDLAGTCVVKVSQNGKDAGNRSSAYLPATDVTLTFTVEADAPSNVLDFQISSGDRSLTVTWKKPSGNGDGGRALKGYEVTWFATEFSGETPITRTDAEITAKLNANPATAFRTTIDNPETLSYTITGLSNGTYYTVIVRAINNANLKSARS